MGNPILLDPRPLLAYREGRTDVEFARVLGVSRHTLRRWRNGNVTIQLATAERAAVALGVHPAALWGLPPEQLDPAWRERAICRGIGNEHFYFEGTKGGGTSVSLTRGSKRAKAMCAVCPVRAECLECALSSADQHGIWGGTSQRERNKILKLRRMVRREAS